ncbi:MAG: glycosyltransferase [Myxococcaceae bacterium]
MIKVFATQGSGGSDEARIRELVSEHPHELFEFRRENKLASFTRLLKDIAVNRPELVVMEGTGTAGGLALLLASAVFGTRYVVSSGDAVGPWVGAQYPVLGPVFGAYERLLCRRSSGFIGWTPYLTGRALTFGARRGMTAPGWAPYPQSEARARIRARLGIPEQALVVGIVGSLAWNRRVGFCYGLELALAVARCERSDVYALIVGDGPGREHVEKVRCAGRTVLTGRVRKDEVPEYLSAMDLASLPQSVDRVGSFRYTTKISEYLAAGLPVVTGRIPLAYDWSGDWLWRLPGDAPWSATYVQALASLLDGLTPEQLQTARAAVPKRLPDFDRGLQIRRTTSFLKDLLEERP